MGAEVSPELGKDRESFESVGPLEVFKEVYFLGGSLVSLTFLEEGGGFEVDKVAHLLGRLGKVSMLDTTTAL